MFLSGYSFYTLARLHDRSASQRVYLRQEIKTFAKEIFPSLCHPGRVAESSTRVDSLIAEFGFNSQQLVVLGLSRSVRSHDTPSVLLGKLDGVDGFGNGSD